MITIKDACLLLGVTPTTIRLYEESMPFSPWPKGENGYRGFYFEHILHLIATREAIRYGIPVKHAFSATLEGPEAARSALLDRREALVGERDYAVGLVEQLDEETALLGKASALLDGYEIVDIPAFFHLSFDTIPKRKEDQRLIREWANLSPLVSFTPFYEMTAAKDDKSSDPPARFGYSIPTRYAHLLETNNPMVKAVPRTRCLATMITMDGISKPQGSSSFQGLPYDPLTFNKVIEAVTAKLAQAGSKLTGDIYTKLVYSDLPQDSRDREPGAPSRCYFYTWTPLKQPLDPAP